ncbi:hypothetical protein HZC00_02990 [Candidatus Kaiserbacteria bacterium]|nr:hypothetical protein [Candidatus Kaiserbacteria bacterium]
MVDEKVQQALQMTACDLHLSKRDCVAIRSDFCAGIIETQWKTLMIGSCSGVLFKATVDDGLGNPYEVNFLLNRRDLEAGADFLQASFEAQECTWVPLGSDPLPYSLSELENFGRGNRNGH